MHPCPFPECDHGQLPEYVFACPRHFSWLDYPQRNEIRAAYQDWIDQRIPLDKLRKIEQRILAEVQTGRSILK